MSWGLVPNSDKDIWFSSEPEKTDSNAVPDTQSETLNCKNTPAFSPGQSGAIGSQSPRQRRQMAFEIRQDTALFEKDLLLPGHPNNGDELLYSNKIGNYSKALPHNDLGEVDINAYQVMIEALTTGNTEIFEDIPLGGPTKLSNPQSSYAYDMTGPDSHHLGMIPAPSFSSSWNGGEMAELYWQALIRDVPFTQYANNQLTIAAALELTLFPDFRGPKINGRVTPQTLFRFDVPGALDGPYISQFLYKDIPFGATVIPQRYRVPLADKDFMTNYSDWLNIQNGLSPTNQLGFNPISRYIFTSRDITEYVHRDFSFQPALAACLILLSLGQEALADNNPYLCSTTQSGFTTFGSPHILDFTAKAARVALEAAWFQKYLVHRRLRPEQFGGNIQNKLTGSACYPIDDKLLASQALSLIYKKYGSYLLPQAYPEGSPTHPSYPSGHASVMGACITILKAFFKESFVLPNPVIPSNDGLLLLPYSGRQLTIGGELNKLASNVSMARDFAGIHWRSDGTEGLNLGEEVAIGILQDYRNTYNEDFTGFSLTKFDGTTVIL